MAMGESGPVVVSGARIIDVESAGLPVSEPSNIVEHRGTIINVTVGSTDASQTFDGGGRFALPGLVNAHDHLYSKELRTPAPGSDIRAMRQAIDLRDVSTTLAVMLRNAWREMAEGVLIIRDLGARHGVNTALARVIHSGIVPGPVVVSAGRPIVMTGGHVWTFGREADGPEECRKAVREQRKAGAQVIKIMASGGVSNYPHEDYRTREFSDVELSAISSEARKLGLPTCAHAYGQEAVAAVVRAGIDSVEHGVDISEEIIEKMAEDGIAYVPTMANMRRIASPETNEAAGVPERAKVFARDIVEPQTRTVAAAHAAGVQIGIGTDSTGSYLEEIKNLIGVGMSPEEVIRAATVEGARICRVDGGSISPGRVAAISLYDEDPREDPEILVRPTAVFIGGRLVETAQLKLLAS